MSLFISDDERHLLEAVLLSPATDGPRLVLADALLSRGERFGEYLSLDVRVAQANVNWETWAWNTAGGARALRETPFAVLLAEVVAGARGANGVDLEVLRHRHRLLELEASRPTWEAELMPGATEVQWERGFPDAAIVRAATMMQRLEPLRCPLTRLEVTDCELFDPVTLVAHPWSQRLLRLTLRTEESVEIERTPVRPKSAERALHLRELWLGHSTLLPSTLHRLGATLGGVETLVLPATHWSDDDFDALIHRAPDLRALTVSPPLDPLTESSALSPRWSELLARPGLEVHFDSTRISAERFASLSGEHSTWAALWAFLQSRQPPAGAASNRSRWSIRRRW